MSENPYEPPSNLGRLSPPPGEPIPSSKRLRTFGVCCGLICSAAFFTLMRYVWRNDNNVLLSNPVFQYLALGAVAIIFVGGVGSLVALIVGNFASTNRHSETPDGSVTVPYGGWIVAGIIVAVLCLLGWLASRDPLSIPAG